MTPKATTTIASAPRATSALLVLASFTCALGSYLAVPVLPPNLYCFRWVAIFLGVLALQRRGNASREVAWMVQPLEFLGAAWLLWGVASLLWTPDVRQGIVELGAVAFGLFVTWSLIVLAGDGWAQVRMLVAGWLLGYAASAGVATWELITGRHLESSYTLQHPELSGARFVTSTFGNPNAFTAFVALSVPLLLLTFFRVRSRLIRLVCLILLGTAPLIGVLSGARMGLAAIAVAILTFLWCYLSGGKRVAALLGLPILFLGIVSVGMQLAGLALSDAIRILDVVNEVQSGGASATRVNLFRNGTRMLAATSGVGVGAGGFSSALRFGSGMEYTAGIVNPHNYLLEVATEYGVLIAFLLILLWVWWFVLANEGLRRARASADPEGRLLAACAMAGLVAYVIASGANSTFIPQPMNWAFLGTTGAMIRIVATREQMHPDPVSV